MGIRSKVKSSALFLSSTFYNMAHKDYVARGRSKKQAPPEPKASLPWLRIVITLTLVTGFSYFLWSIKGTAPESASKNPSSTEQVQNKKDTMPDIPEEEWEFIESLPEYTVQIEELEQKESSFRYLMQCGSFRKEAQAQQLRAKIAFQGLEAQVKTKTGRWYRVILGPYDGKRKAEADRHTLQRAKINRCEFRRLTN